MQKQHIHILGICGTFMGSLAVLAKELGHNVTGSDTNVYPPMSDYLTSKGIDIIQGYNPNQLADNLDVVIVGNIMKRGLAIVEKLLNSEIKYQSGPEWLHDNILKNKKVIALSGTHGKTTTTSLMIKVLEDAGFNPSFLIGGISNDFDVSSRLTESEYFVIEADEYDTAFFDKRSKFIHYNPYILLINNIEFDHSDIFKNIDAIFWQFHQLLRRMPSHNHIVFNDNDENIKTMLSMGCWSQKHPINSNQSVEIKTGITDFSSFVIIDNNKRIHINWQMLGFHNAQNAMAVYKIAKTLGITDTQIQNSINNFGGLKRRLEIIFANENIKVYDDFSHHPTAIKLTLEALKNNDNKSQVTAVIDPCSNTMKNGDNNYLLVDSLDSADTVFIYCNPDLKWSPQYVLKGLKNIVYFDNVQKVIPKIIKTFEPNIKNQVALMSDGGFDGMREELVKKLKNKV